MTIRLHRGDLPDLTRYTGAVAIDTETMGLDPRRDRLCVVQLSPGDGTADVVQIPPGARDAPNIKALLADPVFQTWSALKRMTMEQRQQAGRWASIRQAESLDWGTWRAQSHSIPQGNRIGWKPPRIVP